MIEIILGVLGGVAVVVLLIILPLMLSRQRKKQEELERIRKDEQEKITEKLIRLETLASNPAQLKTLDEINKRLESTTNLFGAIRKDLGEMQQAAKGMQDVGKSISTFQELLLSPKVRGGFGEVLLNELIKDVLPPANYAFQYKFRDGTVVDAVIKTEDRLIPIDSKFPLEEFQRMAEEEMDEERFKSRFKQIMRPRVNEVKKYIKPDEGTLDFAFMYIPSEKLYTRLSGIVDLMASFRNVRVFPVSPSTFYMYLGTILFGLSRLEVEKKTQVILDRIARLSREFDSAKTDWEVVIKHLTNALSKSEDVSKRLSRIDDSVKALVIKREGGQKEIPYEED